MIENHRLGIVLRLLQLSMLVALVSVFSIDTGWMLTDVVPEGHQAYWTDAEAEGFQLQKKGDLRWPFCRDPSKLEYHMQHGEGNHGQPKVFKAEGCVDLMPGEEYIKGESSMFIPTYFQDQWMHQTSGEDCEELKKCCQEGAPIESCRDMEWEQFGTYRDLNSKSLNGHGLCQCVATRSFYVRGVTGMNISLVPSFRAKAPDGKLQTGTTKRKSDDILVIVKSALARRSPNEKGSSLLQMDEEVEGDEPASTASPETHGLAGGSLGTPGLGGVMAFPVPTAQPAGPESRRKGGWAGGATAIEVDSHGGFRMREPVDGIVEEPQTSAGGASGTELPRMRREDHEATAKRRREEPRRSLLGSLLDQLSSSEGPQHAEPTFFEPGEVVGMSVEDWLRHAELLGIGPMSSVTSSTDSVLDAENQMTKRNLKVGSVDHATYRTTGLELTIDMQFQNKAVHKRRDHNGKILLIRVLARPDWEEVPVVHNIMPLVPGSGNAQTVKRLFHGIRIRFNSGGRFARFSVASSLTTASSFILYLQVPSMVIGFIAIYLLGVSSDFYYEASNERMALKNIACNYVARMLQGYSAFRAGQGVGRRGQKSDEGEDAQPKEEHSHEDEEGVCYTRERLIREVGGMAESEQPDFDSDASKLADMMLEEHDDDRKGYLTVEDMTQATLDTDATTLKGISELIDKGRSKFFLESLLVPDLAIQDERSVWLRAKKAELFALMRARMEEEQRLAEAAAAEEMAENTEVPEELSDPSDPSAVAGDSTTVGAPGRPAVPMHGLGGAGVQGGPMSSSAGRGQGAPPDAAA